MTITTAPIPVSFNGDDVTVNFSIPWKYFAESHVLATLRSAADVETPQVLDTDYTLTVAGVDSGGTLTMTTAPATGETLNISLVPPNTQASPIPLGGSFPSPVVEDALDRAAQRSARLEALLDRAIIVPITDTQTGILLNMPIDSLRANKFMSFDSNGKPTVAAGTSANLGPVSAFIDTLLDDADAVTARQTLLLDKSGADVASTGTVNLDMATGDFVDITGTNTITAITLSDGVEKTVRFAAALTLTHGASLLLPGAADIITAVNDIAVFRGDASGVVRCVDYRIALIPPLASRLETITTANIASLNFLALPSWVRKITFLFQGLSTDGTSNQILQLGDSGGIETSGYSGSVSDHTTVSAISTAGFNLDRVTAATSVLHGELTLTLMDPANNIWVCKGSSGNSDTAGMNDVTGSKALSGTLDRLRLTTVNGTDLYDGGTVNVFLQS